MSASSQPQQSPTSVTAAPSSTKAHTKLAHKAPHQSSIPEMNIDKRVVDELLLICSVIGSNDATTGEFVPVTDCLAWLQDLQRALRRDNDGYRPIGLLLGQWNVVKTKLLPLVMSCRYDRGVVLTVLKILVILTKPLNESALRAGKQTIDVKSGKFDDSVIKEQIKLRENAIAQSDLLMEYKKMIVEHPSHRYAFQHAKKSDQSTVENKEEKGLLSIFTSLLAEPLSRTNRTSSDHLQIELVLHFVRNLLSIQPMSWGTESRRENAKLSAELVVLLEKEMMLEVLICVGQEVEKRENEGYNLLLMEILSYLLKGQDPSDVAKSAIEATKQSTTLSPRTKSMKTKNNKSTRTIMTSKTTASTSLRSRLQSERDELSLHAPSRHSNFGGTLLVSFLGKRRYVSATDYLAKPSHYSTFRHQPARRKNKKTEVFIGSKKSVSSFLDCGPNENRAKIAISSFCHKFVKQCYGPVMKSWKNEFRRDSNRLEDGDRTMFFRIVWFFHRWWRFCRENDLLENESDEKVENKCVARNLIFTMDVFMFNLVLNSTDEYHEHKKPKELSQTVALYSEMLKLLEAMYESTDSTERMMALGLMDRIFYASEPLDQLPRLFSRWTPGMFGREYLVNLVESCHVALKLLDVNAKRCAETFLESGDKKRPKDAVERMNLTAYEFDKDAYFTRKFVSNHIVFMYTQLLSQYATNEAHVNRHVVAYFVRLCKFQIKSGDGDLEYDDVLGENEIAAKQSTYEPMLYNIGMFSALETILNDTAIRGKDDFSALLMFATSLMKRFARAADANPMLFVEALFRHPIPHRFCECTTNMYVNEELRMIAVRDLLLADEKRYEQDETDDKDDTEENQESDNVAEAQGYDDDEEEEVEFNGDDIEEGEFIAVKKRRKLRKKKRHVIAEDPSEQDQEESNNNDEDADAEFDTDDKLIIKDEDVNAEEIGIIDTADSESKLEDNGDQHEPEGQASIPISSGKKRIRKSQQMIEDSDDEDFSAPVKVVRRTILDDDDDDEE